MFDQALIATARPVKPLSYFFQGELQPGTLVEVPLKGQPVQGIVMEVGSAARATEEILKVVDEVPLLTSEQLELGRWMSERYLVSPGEAYFKMFPAWQKKKKGTSPSDNAAGGRSLLPLYPAQEEILNRILSKEKTHLLHGITGSGKTEIYIHLIDHFLTLGRSSILLLPEIALSVQIIERLRGTFGDELALMHSSRTPSDRRAAYRAVLGGEKRIVVGTRSAIFAPLKNLGLIILDEEHDPSYKEHSAPRYHARQIAEHQARQQQATLLLGSATPAVETYFHARYGERIGYHRLTDRAAGGRLPTVQLIHRGNDPAPISARLLTEIERNLERREQTLILLNRRGYHPYLVCSQCDRALTCEHCSVSLCMHRGGELRCHYCNHVEQRPACCPSCQGSLAPRSVGTQKLEEYLLEKLPTLRLARLDSDVSRRRDGLSVLDDLLAGSLDVLVGTQMIAKGLDAPEVTLVGVLQADRGLYMPDFRAAERTFHLLTQVAGRAGRREKEGRVFLELSAQPTEVIRDAIGHDYESFVSRELAVRRAASYPPFCRLIRLLYRSVKEEHAQSQAALLHSELCADLATVKSTEILPAAPAPIEKINGQYRWHIIIKTQMLPTVRGLIGQLIARRKEHHGVHLEIDFDPVDLF